MPAALPASSPSPPAASASRPTTATARGSAPAAAPRPSVFRSDDRGVSWTAAPTPIRSGPTAGIFGARLPRPAARARRRRRLPAPSRPPRTASPARVDGGSSWSLASGRAVRSTAPARRGSTGTPRSRSAPPAATSAGTAARRGSASTTAASTPSTARARRPAGRRARTAASPTSFVRASEKPRFCEGLSVGVPRFELEICGSVPPVVLSREEGLPQRPFFVLSRSRTGARAASVVPPMRPARALPMLDP